MISLQYILKRHIITKKHHNYRKTLNTYINNFYKKTNMSFIIERLDSLRYIKIYSYDENTHINIFHNDFHSYM